MFMHAVTSEEVQPAAADLKSESPVPGSSEKIKTELVDDEQVEAPEASVGKPKMPRLLLG